MRVYIFLAVMALALLALVCAKFCGWIGWSWWLVLSPLWIVIILWVIFAIIVEYYMLTGHE